MLVHGHKTDAVHQADPHTPQIEPEFVCPLMAISIHPPYFNNGQDVFAPKTGRLEADSFLQQTDCFPHHIVRRNQGNVVIEQQRPQLRGFFVVPIRAIQERIERWCVDVNFVVIKHA